MTARSLLLLAGCSAACLGAAAPMPPHRITIDDIMALQEVSQPRLSPDGGEVLFQVERADIAADAMQTHIWLAKWDGSRAVALTSRPKESETDPRWSPDGTGITFLSDRGSPGVSQLWRMERDGGEAVQLSHLPGSIDSYAWAPNGKFIALIADDAAGKVDDGGAPKPVVLDRFQFKRDVDGYLGATRRHLYLFDVATRNATQLLSGKFDEALPAVSPDSRSIAFVSKRGGDADRSDFAVYTIAAAAGAPAKKITDFDGDDGSTDWDSPPAWSPDGGTIAYVHGGPKKLIEYGVRSLAVVPASGGPARVLTAGLDRNVSRPSWSVDGKSIRFLVEDDRAQYLASIDAEGGTIGTLAGGRRVVLDYTASAGGHIAVLSGRPTDPVVISGLDAGGEHEVANPNAAWRAAIVPAGVREIAFPSADGTDIHGFLLTPPGYVAGHPVPTILALHGGPQDQLDLRFDHSVAYYLSPQLLASHGYAVVAVNPRGSTGRGEKFAAGIYADWGHKDAQDVLAAVDYAVREGVADPARLGIGGWSYGGMLTNYVIAQDHRFRAATSGASTSNILAGYGTDEYVRDYEAELGTPWDNTAAWEKVSFPFLHADRISTPTLFMGGDKDFNVPLLNQEQMYQALRSRNIETQLVIYPGSFHVQTRPSYIMDRTARDLAWFDAHLRK